MVDVDEVHNPRSVGTVPYPVHFRVDNIPVLADGGCMWYWRSGLHRWVYRIAKSQKVRVGMTTSHSVQIHNRVLR